MEWGELRLDILPTQLLFSVNSVGRDVDLVKTFVHMKHLDRLTLIMSPVDCLTCGLVFQCWTEAG